MAAEDTKLTVLQVINKVQERLGVNPTPTLIGNKQSKILLQLLNETLDEVSDFGDWQEMYTEVTAQATSGQAVYTLGSAGVTYPIKSIYEIAYDTRPQSLYNVEIEEINQLARASQTFGEPRQFAVKGVDIYKNPSVQVHPRPGGQQNGRPLVIALFRKPRNYAYNSLDEEIEFNGNLIVLGVLYKALIHENGGQNTDQSKQIRELFIHTLQETLNRFNGDTGTFVQLSPQRH